MTLPLCNVDIGVNYIDDYIMKEAGGVYVEYHDRPHFHMPREPTAGGYIILGRDIDEYILLAAFLKYHMVMPYIHHRMLFTMTVFTR